MIDLFRKGICFVMIIFIGIRSIAQRFDYYYRSAEDDWFLNAAEDENGNFYLLTYIGDINQQSYHSNLIKLNSSGEYLDKVEIGSNTHRNLLFSIFIDDPKNLYVFGSTSDSSGSMCVTIWKFNQDLELMWAKNFGRKADYIGLQKVRFNQIGNYFYFSFIEERSSYWRSSIGKVDMNGDSIFQKFYDYGGKVTVINDLIEAKSQTFLIMDTLIGSPQFAKLDAAYEVDTSFDLTGRAINIFNEAYFRNRVSFELISDTSFMIAGIVDNDQFLADSEYDFAVQIRTMGYTEDTTVIKHIKHIREQPGYNNLSIGNGKIYGGTLSGLDEVHLLTSSLTNEFYLAELDSNGYIINDHFYSNNSCLTFNGVLATKDGGALIYGASYLDGFNDPAERDAYVLKVDSNGMADITPAGISGEMHPDNIRIFPNPASTLLNIEVGDFSKEQDIKATIFSMEGRKIYSTNIREQNTLISLSSMPSGMYFVKIESESMLFTQRLLVQ